MKKLLVLSIVTMSIKFSAFSQKLDASKVPVPVKTSFERHFPGASVKWEKEGRNYEAGFKQNGKIMSALFKADGTMTESEMDIKVPDLPATILTYVQEHYNGKTIKEAAKITKAGGAVNYEAEVNGKDVIFDANGRFLKEAKG